VVPDRSELTEHDLLATDLPPMLRNIVDDRRVFGEGAVAAALRLAALDAYPRSLTFLAEVVRRGGLAVALGVSELMPTAEQHALVRGWLEAAADTSDDDPFAREEAMARWLGSVATILAVRASARPTT
jgi:hypothetical protein